MIKADGNQVYAISGKDVFRFSCGPDLICFNECCRDLNQFLTPYDVLRLKTHLGITSSTFLETYARCHDGPVTGLPVVILRPLEGAAKKCPFVHPEGCRVYDGRPTSCRMYPLARVTARDPLIDGTREDFMLIRESHCQGFENGRELTPVDWMEDQGLGSYNAANDKIIQIIGLKQRRSPGVMARDFYGRIYTALYDLDHFRELVKNSPSELPGLERLDITNEEALLDAALELVAGWLR